MAQVWRNNLGVLRKMAGVSQEALAREIGVAKNTVTNWENCYNDIPALKLIALAEFFGCSLDDVMGYRPRSKAG